MEISAERNRKELLLASPSSLFGGSYSSAYEGTDVKEERKGKEEEEEMDQAEAR